MQDDNLYREIKIRKPYIALMCICEKGLESQSSLTSVSKGSSTAGAALSISIID